MIEVPKTDFDFVAGAKAVDKEIHMGGGEEGGAVSRKYNK